MQTLNIKIKIAGIKKHFKPTTHMNPFKTIGQNRTAQAYSNCMACKSNNLFSKIKQQINFLFVEIVLKFMTTKL